MSEINHKLAAIVFTDIVGYTKQMEEDEVRMLHLLQKQRDIISPIVKLYEGEIIKELGDGLLLMFSSAVNAVRCAISVQTRLSDEDLTIRAGIHIGEVIFKDGDVFGSAVNVAARIQPLASANGVCISDAVKKQVQNQTDIRMHSIGLKELKGIKEPMEIFEVLIEGVTQAKKKDIKYLYNDLWSRRVIHVMAIYLLGVLFIRMAISSYVNSQMLSPHLVQLAWVILLSLTPTVFLLTYYHGYRSSGKWTKAELIGFPSNAVFSIFLIIFLFNGKDLGAATTTVTLMDENGKKIERTIVKNEFRKKTLVFFFENKTTDTSLNWLQYALPNLIEYDASQDIFWEVWGAGNFIEKLRKEGAKDGIITSLMLNKGIATDLHRNTFMTGTYTVTKGKYIVVTKLYSTESGKLIAENQFTGENVFQIVDEITLKLKKDLGIPENHIEETEDMPIAEISTASFSALGYYTRGIIEVDLNNKWGKGILLIKKAIKEDKDFILAYLNLAKYYVSNNQTSEAMNSFQIVMDGRYKLPERQQYSAKYTYYTLKQEPDNALNLCGQWAKLYPEDITPHEYLASIYSQRNETQKLVQECKTVLGLDPEQFKYIRLLGEMYKFLAKYDSAKYYYQQYLEKFPKDYRSYSDLGDLHMKMADYEKAKQYFDNAILLEPGNIPVMLALADLDLCKGNPDGAYKIYREAVAASKSAADSSMVIYKLSDFYILKGQMVKALECFIMGLDKSARFDSPLGNLIQTFSGIDKYVKAGKSKEALELLRNAEKEMQPPFNKFSAFGYIIYYTETRNADEAEKYLPVAMEFIKGFRVDFFKYIIYYAQGRISEIRRNYKTALENYVECSKIIPGEYGPFQFISRCQRELGNTKEAEISIEKALKQQPFDPENNYEAAMLYFKLNKNPKAKEHLDRALKVWKDADTNYEPYRKALVVKRQLGAV